jgi:hypothetical protein
MTEGRKLEEYMKYEIEFRLISIEIMFSSLPCCHCRTEIPDRRLQ